MQRIWILFIVIFSIVLPFHGMELTAGLAPDATSPTPFEIPGFQHEPAQRTPWTRWLNTFDFRGGAGDPDFYTGRGFRPHGRPSNYRITSPGRFGVGGPVFVREKLRTQMLWYMGRNCPSYQATIELFVRSQEGRDIWNDAKEHHVFHLYGPKGPSGPITGIEEQDQALISLIKTAGNTLLFRCQGNILELPVAHLDPQEWYHLALSWDTSEAPGRLWLTLDGNGVSAAARKPLRRLEYVVLLIGNSPRESDRVFDSNFVDWSNSWPRLSRDIPAGQYITARYDIYRGPGGEKLRFRYDHTTSQFVRRRYGELIYDPHGRPYNLGDTDIYPLEAIVDEIHISEQTLADRLPAKRQQQAQLPVDWDLYQRIEDLIRLHFYHHWVNALPIETKLGNKNGAMTAPGREFGRMFELYGDLWFLDRAERFGTIALKAQQPAGHFTTSVRLVPEAERRPDQLRGAETGLARVWAGGTDPESSDWARIQDGFQDGPMNYLLYLYRLTGKQVYCEAAMNVADLFVAAQNPNGSWSGSYNVRTKKGHIADNRQVTQGGEFDDGAISRPFNSLLFAYHVTRNEEYLQPLVRCADWILQAEIVTPHIRGWASFYDAENNPVQARPHEPPKMASRVFPMNVGPLMTQMYQLTGDRRYLDGIRKALQWYQEHRTEKGWAFFYNNDGTQHIPEKWTTNPWYGPDYGHFRDITDIEGTLAAFDRGDFRPRTEKRSFAPTPQALEAVHRSAVGFVTNPALLRQIRRDVQLLPKMEWVPHRPRWEPDLYGLQYGGGPRLDPLVSYLYHARVLAGKIPPDVLMGFGENWLVENLHDTPLRKTE